MNQAALAGRREQPSIWPHRSNWRHAVLGMIAQKHTVLNNFLLCNLFYGWK